MPFPYMHENGGICCNDIKLCCDSCKAKLVAESRTAVTPTTVRRPLRTADAAPPDPYANARAIELTPDLDPNYDPGTGAPADGYAIALMVEQVKRGGAEPVVPSVSGYDAPCPYAAGIQKMRSENR